jgi:hypothetical protein
LDARPTERAAEVEDEFMPPVDDYDPELLGLL